jgi:hypothetical protein
MKQSYYGETVTQPARNSLSLTKLIKKVGLSVKASELCSGGARFEYRLEHRLA